MWVSITGGALAQAMAWDWAMRFGLPSPMLTRRRFAQTTARGVQAEGDVQAETTQWVQENERHRRVVAGFVSQEPFGNLMIIRQLLEPWRGPMEKYMTSAGSKWDQEQDAKEADAIMSGAADAPPRAFRIVTYAYLEFEHALFVDLIVALQVAQWRFLPLRVGQCGRELSSSES